MRTNSGPVGPPSSGTGIDLSGGLVYVAEYDQGVKIFNTGTTSQGTVNDTFMARDVATAGRLTQTRTPSELSQSSTSGVGSP